MSPDVRVRPRSGSAGALKLEESRAKRCGRWRLLERAATVGALMVCTPGGDMPTATARPIVLAQVAPTLHLALDLGNATWKLAFGPTPAHPPRPRHAGP